MSGLFPGGMSDTKGTTGSAFCLKVSNPVDFTQYLIALIELFHGSFVPAIDIRMILSGQLIVLPPNDLNAGIGQAKKLQSLFNLASSEYIEFDPVVYFLQGIIITVLNVFRVEIKLLKRVINHGAALGVILTFMKPAIARVADFIRAKLALERVIMAASAMAGTIEETYAHRI